MCFYMYSTLIVGTLCLLLASVGLLFVILCAHVFPFPSQESANWKVHFWNNLCEHMMGSPSFGQTKNQVRVPTFLKTCFSF